jgi:hypothetical protein
VPNGPDYGTGAASATITGQPAGSYARLERAVLSWQGGRLGHDRPVDKAFVTAQRLRGKRWVTEDSDLGTAMLWGVDGRGVYTARWEIPRSAPRGSYRLLVTGKRYRFVSKTFRVFGSQALRVVPVEAPAGKLTVRLAYPQAVENVDLTYRPRFATGGIVKFRVGSKTVTVKRRSSPFFTIAKPVGKRVDVVAGGAKDGFNNVNGAAANVSSR